MPPYDTYGDYADDPSGQNMDQGTSAGAQVTTQPYPGSSESFLGGLVGSITDMFTHSRTNANNAMQAAADKQFQMYMASSGHRREMTDLTAAGLNPILTGMGGAGAPAAPGRVIPYEAGDPGGTGVKIASALQANQALNSQIDVNDATKKKLMQDTSTSEQAEKVGKAQETQIGAQTLQTYQATNESRARELNTVADTLHTNAKAAGQLIDNQRNSMGEAVQRADLEAELTRAGVDVKSAPVAAWIDQVVERVGKVIGVGGKVGAAVRGALGPGPSSARGAQAAPSPSVSDPYSGGLRPRGRMPEDFVR